MTPNTSRYKMRDRQSLYSKEQHILLLKLKKLVTFQPNFLTELDYNEWNKGKNNSTFFFKLKQT